MRVLLIVLLFALLFSRPFLLLPFAFGWLAGALWRTQPRTFK